MNLVDILRGINQDAGQALSPDVSPTELLAQFVSLNETMHLNDIATTTFTAATKTEGTWGDGSLWGADTWGP
jgi:hypothetical protein